MGHIAHQRNLFKSINTFELSYDYIITLKPIISYLTIEWSLFVKPCLSFMYGCFVSSLGEIGPVVLKKFHQCIFPLSLLSSIGKGHDPSFAQV